mgnify:FL=1
MSQHMSILSDEEYIWATRALERLQDIDFITWSQAPDGTWTEHPALFPFMEGFEAHMAIAVGEFSSWDEYRSALAWAAFE